MIYLTTFFLISLGGLGFETVKQLAEMKGNTIIFTARSSRYNLIVYIVLNFAFSVYFNCIYVK